MVSPGAARRCRQKGNGVLRLVSRSASDPANGLNEAVWGKSFVTEIIAIESGTEHKEEDRQHDLKAVTAGHLFASIV